MTTLFIKGSLAVDLIAFRAPFTIVGIAVFGSWDRITGVAT